MRALEGAEKGLKRRNAELAVTELLKAPPPDRAVLLPQIGQLLREEVLAAHARRDWSRLAFWAARVEREPRLLGEDAAPVLWALCWGCALTREFGRARRLHDGLRGPLAQRAPRLANALEAWLAADGSPAPEALAGLSLSTTPAADPRLGHEPVRRRRTHPAPAREEEVEERVLSLCALEPWSVFAHTLQQWWQAAPAGVRRSLQVLGGKLAVREQLRRRAAGEPSTEPTALLAQAISEGNAPAELSEDALTAFRVVASGLTGAVLSREPEVRELETVALAAMAYAPYLEGVAASLQRTSFSNEVGRPALKLLERLSARRASLALCLKGLNLWRDSQPDSRSPPAWVEAAVKRVAGQGALLRELDALSPADRVEFLAGASMVLSPELGEAVLEQCWEQGSAELREDLVDFIQKLLTRSRIDSAVGALERLGGDDPEFEEVMGLLMADVEDSLELPPRGLAFWRRWEERVLPHHPAFLEQSVALAQTERAASEAVERYLSGPFKAIAHLDAIRCLEGARFRKLANRITERMMKGLGEDLEALADAALLARKLGAPHKLLSVLLGAFARTYEQLRPTGPSSRAVLGALHLCRTLEPGRTSRRGAGAKKKPRAKKKAAPKKKKGPPPQNEEIPF